MLAVMCYAAISTTAAAAVLLLAYLKASVNAKLLNCDRARCLNNYRMEVIRSICNKHSSVILKNRRWLNYSARPKFIYEIDHKGYTALLGGIPLADCYKLRFEI